MCLSLSIKIPLCSLHLLYTSTGSMKIVKIVINRDDSEMLLVLA